MNFRPLLVYNTMWSMHENVMCVMINNIQYVSRYDEEILFILINDLMGCDGYNGKKLF